MTLSETLALLRTKEKETGRLLKNALSIKRYREKSTLEIRRSDAYCLPAVNSKARIKWGTVFIDEIFPFFKIADGQHGPHEPIFLVTIADKSHLTTHRPQQIQLSRIKRQIAVGLMGLSYVGLIEPGYYNVIYDEFGNQWKNVVSWHGHFLVWGISEKPLAKHLAKSKSRYTPLMPGLCPVHKKRIPPEQFWYKLWYILKAPRKEIFHWPPS
jgi:hypothetical protein